MMVDERKWMTAEEFNDLYALCNFLPGPNIVNFSAVSPPLRRHFRCAAGAARPSWTAVRDRDLDRGAVRVLRQHRSLQRMFAAVAAAAAGLTIARP